MRRLLDVAILLVAVGVSLLWWRGFAQEPAPPPAPEPEPMAVVSPPAPVPNPPSPTAEEPQPMDEETLKRQRMRDELRRLDEEWAASKERERLEFEEASRRAGFSEEELKQRRRDRERAEEFAKLRTNQRQRVRDSERHTERVREAQASYEALKQAQYTCTHVTGKGSIVAYGCEGINERVRKAENNVKRARNER